MQELVDDGIRGLTSNPTIFAKAVATGQYDDLVKREIEAGHDAQAIYQQIAVSDVGDAADVLRPVYDASIGTDGFASIEVEPDLADDTDAHPCPRPRAVEAPRSAEHLREDPGDRGGHPGGGGARSPRASTST